MTTKEVKHTKNCFCLMTHSLTRRHVGTVPCHAMPYSEKHSKRELQKQ